MIQKADPAETIARFVMAKSSMEKAQEYAHRGDRYAALSEHELQALFLEAFREWVADPTELDKKRRAENLGAEYALRSAEPPYDMVKPEIDRLVQFVSEFYDAMTDQQIDAISDDMAAGFAGAVKNKN